MPDVDRFDPVQITKEHLDPTKDPDKVFAGRLREFGHLLYFDTYENVFKSQIPEGARKVDMRWEERPKGDECPSRLVLRD